MATVSFNDATRVYPGGDRPAVDKLNLEIGDGEFMVLVGPSGWAVYGRADTAITFGGTRATYRYRPKPQANPWGYQDSPRDDRDSAGECQFDLGLQLGLARRGRGLRAGDDRQERIAAREGRKIDFRIERAVRPEDGGLAGRHALGRVRA